GNYRRIAGAGSFRSAARPRSHDRSDSLQQLRHLFVLAGRRIHTGLGLSVGWTRSDGGRSRLRPLGEDSDALLSARRTPMEAVSVDAGLERDRLEGPVGAGPEQRIGVSGAGPDASRGDQAWIDRRAFADLDAVPNRTLGDLRSGSDTDPTEDARFRGELRDRDAGEDPSLFLEDAGLREEGTTPRERFERRAEEISRAAEIGEGAFVKHVADLLAAREHRLPEVPEERSFPFGNHLEQPRREDADSRIEKRPRARASETRDSIP